MAEFGNNAMLCANPVAGEIRRFLTGPMGQEITGVVTTPDQRTMFINVQHPGATTTAEALAAGDINSHWPDGGGAVLVDRRDHEDRRRYRWNLKRAERFVVAAASGNRGRFSCWRRIPAVSPVWQRR